MRPRRVSDRDDWVPFDHPPPIPVADGIRARSRRGDIGRTWWSRRFLAALETYYGTTASRLARGRAYARAGQVVRMGLEAGRVEGIVQGSRPTPYTVTIRVRVLDDADWQRVERALAARAIFLARLLAGEMPDEVEEAFEAVTLRLFPSRRGDLRTACTCPDTANPCKHTAAVYYLLAESFDADPFLIFAWRGRSREALVADLRTLRRSREARPPDSGRAARSQPPVASEPGDPLERFWYGGLGWREVPIEPRPTGPVDALLREVHPDVERAWPGGVARLRTVYAAAAAAARRWLDPSGPAGPAVRGRRHAPVRRRRRER